MDIFMTWDLSLSSVKRLCGQDLVISSIFCDTTGAICTSINQVHSEAEDKLNGKYSHSQVVVVWGAL